MPTDDRIVAIGLLTARDLSLLGTTFSRAYLIDETPCFGELLRAIDEADRTTRLERCEANESARQTASQRAQADTVAEAPEVPR
jgi:hypothetical protein